MKKIRILLTVSGFLIWMTVACKYASEPDNSKVKVMLVAGGHSFDTLEFVEMFSSFENISFDTILQPRANQMIASGEADSYDVLVFYDMWSEADSVVKEGYYSLLNQGKGMIFLHHSLVSYQSWEEFKSIIGGKYYKASKNVDSSLYSTYMHDIELNINVASEEHPLTRSLNDFSILDEGYNHIEVNSDVKVLLTTDHPDCAPYIGWENSYANSRIVYLMLGHDKQAYANQSYRTLLNNAIHYVRKD